jgi:hypothetical protein
VLEQPHFVDNPAELLVGFVQVVVDDHLVEGARPAPRMEAL